MRWIPAPLRADDDATPPLYPNSATELHAFLWSNVDAMWTYARNPTLNLFAVDWVGPAPLLPNLSVPVHQAQQNSATMSLLLFSSL